MSEGSQNAGSQDDESCSCAGSQDDESCSCAGSQDDESCLCAGSQDNESCSGLIEGTILFKNCSACDLSRCVLEVDETLRCKRLLTPKNSQQRKTSSFCKEKGELLARKCSIIRSIQIGTSRWIEIGPSSYVPEDETLDSIKTINSQENLNLAVTKWLERTLLLSIKKTLDNNSNLEGNDQDGDCRVSDDMDRASFSEQSEISNMDTDNCFEIDNMSTSSSAFQEVTASDEDVSWEGGEIIDGHDTITSYMLKNCLFYVANDLKDADKNISHLDITIKLFEKLQSCAKAKRLESFFLPYLNVFTFTNEHIKMIPEDEVIESTKIQCHRIQLFCEVILGILRQNMQNTID
ncbi:uncharacterized protein LOC128181762 [Crassostrea angulata]|uniref:uncharacterized protein LOC128181762 n=1 Tax=Magallana angulata TaxID=2784310 RepID=UPI0022B18D80|nr:uncharacterized protein LOC128181762 [Crassostrea angulata]